MANFGNNHHLSKVKAIFVLPELGEDQEWACEQGCDIVKPRLYKNIYSETRTHAGVLLEQLSEHYYTCSREHLLMVWCTQKNGYVELPAHHYQDPNNQPVLDQNPA